MVSVLASNVGSSSGWVAQTVGTITYRVKPKTTQLVCFASTQSTRH
jgi:hypothetical protein